jgi:DNA helicase-2/ATP-dependent DNA helicase PcrA
MLLADADADAVRRVLGVPFSDQQLAAVTAPLSPGAIVAGAGSGKTTVMAARVVWLVGRGLVTPDQVLGLTFTRKAAAELASRVRRGLGRLADDAGEDLGRAGEPTITTYHAFAASLVAEHGLRLGLEPDRRLVTDASRFQRAARVVTRHPARVVALGTYLPSVVEDLVALDAHMSDHLVEPDEVRAAHQRLRAEVAPLTPNPRIRAALASAAKRDELVDLVECYRQAKTLDGVCDFADQMAWGAKLATRSAAVGESARDRFAVVLLDEYQDTSVAQRLMVQGLFSGPTPQRGRGHPVTAVGDPCQAIYGWRGASVENIDAFPGHFPTAQGAPAPVHALSVNRRCGADVLAAANSLAGRLYQRHPGVRPLEPDQNTGAGEVRAALLPDVASEIEHVADAVLTARAEADVVAPQRPPARWSDIAVLVRNGAEVAGLAAALRLRGVPVEVVGLSGLLSQPEVADVLATVEVVHSLTANAALLRLLTGPRWRIGARDLALLGRRARELSRGCGTRAAEGLQARLDEAVAGTDPTEVLSLCDALDDPGSGDYSAEARSRFTALSGELVALRRAGSEPLVDLVRRVITTIDLDVELDASPDADAAAARDNLAALVDAVAEFSSTDPYASLPGLLAYLRAEEEFNAGMTVAAPTETDSVKLLTAHRAKGLEWRVVMVPFLSASVFPSGRSPDRWTTTARVLPSKLRGDADSLPALSGWEPVDDRAFRVQATELSELEELRLAYVAMTRAKDLVVLTGHWWGRTQKKPRGPSAYLGHVRAWLEATGRSVGPWAPDPEDYDQAARDESGTLVNPLLAARSHVRWPAPLDGDLLGRRRAAAALVRSHQAGEVPAVSGAPTSQVEADQLDRLAALDAETEILLSEAARSRIDTVAVDLPESLSATGLLRLAADPQAYARALARPMPRKPSAAARFGTRFHARIETHVGQQSLLGPDELPGRADTGIGDEAELAYLVAAFEAGPYAGRRPVAVEAPFQLALGGHVVRGRIDAVYARPDGADGADGADGFEVVEWKTGSAARADPLQLVVYRLAWAEMHGLPLEQVSAAFVCVRTGEVRRPPLADRAALEALVAAAARAPAA